MKRIACSEEYEKDIKMLAGKMDAYLHETKDPRLTGGEMKWIGAKYYAEKDFRPAPSAHAIKELGLEEAYSYVD